MKKNYIGDPISEDWTVSENLMVWFFNKYKQAKEEDLRYEEEQFRDYYLAGGQQKYNWDAAFRFWCRLSFRLGGKTQTLKTNSKPARVSASNDESVRTYLDRYNSESNVRAIRSTKGKSRS